MKTRHFVDRVARSLVGVGMFGSALFGKRQEIMDSYQQAAVVVFDESWVGRSIVVIEDQKFAYRTFEFADDDGHPIHNVQPNFPFPDDLVPREDNFFFLET